MTPVDTMLTKEQLAQIQRELAEKQAEADRQRKQLSALEKQQADARKQTFQEIKLCPV